MKLTIMIDSDNAGSHTKEAVCKIARGVVAKIEGTFDLYGNIMDRNGNTIGNWKVVETELICDHCGKPFEMQDNGTTSHIDSFGVIDFEENDDHVARMED